MTTEARRKILVGIAWLLAVVIALPLGWLLVAGLKPEREVFTTSLPWPLEWNNFLYVLTRYPLPRFLLNSFVVAGATTFFSLWFHSMAAYALARLRFPGRSGIFAVVISTMMVSLQVTLVPLFLVVRELGLLDSYAGLIIPGIFHAFGIFLLRQYYLSLPDDLEDAAQVDGCGHWSIYWHIVLPLSRPMLSSLGVLFFLVHWNAFLWPLTITESPSLRVVQLGLASLQGEYGAQWHYILAASVVATVPTVAVFLFGQRWLVNALKTAGIR